MEVPQALASLPQWVNWRIEDGRKVPINPATGRKAKSNKPATWTSLADAQATGEQLGFVFATDGGLFGVDLDGCIVDGEVQQWALEVLERLPTYAELSPSGIGIKIYGRGKVPSERGKKRSVPDVRQCAEKSAAIEAYDHGRFFAFTGEHWPESPHEVAECQDGLDWVFAKYWPEQVRDLIVVRHPVVQCTGSDLEDRARKYLATIPPAVSGNHGHNQTFRAACVLVLGFALELEVAFRVLSWWNQECQPPWSDAELWHKLTDANQRDGERGWLLHGGHYEGSDVDLRALLADVEPQEVVQSRDVAEFPADCLDVPGLIGDIMAYNLATALYPQPELALAAAIALVGTITGRKVCDSYGTRTNVLILGLGLSGTGKEHARKVNKEILLRSGCEKMIGSERVGSHAGIVTAVFEQPAILLQLDEIGRLLETCKDARRSPHLYACITVLMQLYTSSNTLWKADAYADAKKVKTIDQPHLCLYGTATPDSFWQSLSTENIGEGLMGRLMVFEGRGYETKMQRPSEEQLPTSLLEAFRWWHQFAPGGNLGGEHPAAHRVPHTADAAARYESHTQAINERRVSEDHLRAAVWSRSGEKANKLALIHACSRSGGLPSEITYEDIDWGIRLANYLTRRLLLGCGEHVSENDVEKRAKRVLRLIGSGISANDLARKTQWLRSRERSEILGDLMGCGLVISEQIETVRRPKTVYRRASISNPKMASKVASS
jgi:hypothetical protein